MCLIFFFQFVSNCIILKTASWHVPKYLFNNFKAFFQVICDITFGIPKSDKLLPYLKGITIRVQGIIFDLYNFSLN